MAERVVYSEDDAKLVAEMKALPFPPLINDNALRAAKGLPVSHVPVWIHRQAGRYLPEFLAVRAKHPFFEVCRSPSLAAEVTVQPIDRFASLDCSIIFSDILVIPQAMGLECLMKDSVGPVFPDPIRTPADLERANACAAGPDAVHTALQYVYDAITVTRHQLGGRVPLIGFCGAPWTLFAYMVDGGGSHGKGFLYSKSFLYDHPEASHTLLQRITDICVHYLVGQACAGAQMLQVFESNAGELSADMFEEFALPYLAQIAYRVKEMLAEKGITSSVTSHSVINQNTSPVEDASIPITCFARLAPHAIPKLSALCYDTLSIDGAVDIAQAREWTNNPVVSTNPEVSKYIKKGVSAHGVDKDLAHSVTLQGNLDPICLFARDEVISQKTHAMVQRFGVDRYIANLGHGMMPKHEPRAVKTFTEAVHEASSKIKAQKQ